MGGWMEQLNVAFKAFMRHGWKQSHESQLGLKYILLTICTAVISPTRWRLHIILMHFRTKNVSTSLYMITLSLNISICVKAPHHMSSCDDINNEHLL